MGNEDRRVDRQSDDFLAIERDGDTWRISIPNDGLTALHMLEELTHQVKMREINQAYTLRKNMATLNGNGHGVVSAKPTEIERFTRHRRS